VRTDCKHSRITGKTGSYPPRREKANSGKELILLVVWKYLSGGRCHGRGREFESRRPRHIPDLQIASCSG
jgi:hypothetical protein